MPDAEQVVEQGAGRGVALDVRMVEVAYLTSANTRAG